MTKTILFLATFAVLSITAAQADSGSMGDCVTLNGKKYCNVEQAQSVAEPAQVAAPEPAYAPREERMREQAMYNPRIIRSRYYRVRTPYFDGHRRFDEQYMCRDSQTCGFSPLPPQGNIWNAAVGSIGLSLDILQPRYQGYYRPRYHRPRWHRIR